METWTEMKRAIQVAKKWLSERSAEDVGQFGAGVREWADVLSDLAREWIGSRRTADADVLREREARAEAALRAEAFRAAIRSFDSAVVARSAAAWLRDDWSCDNVIWMPRGTLQAELAHYDGGRNAESFVHGATRGQVQAAAPLSDGALAAMFKRWGPHAPERAPLEPGALVRASSEEDRSDVLLTLIAPDAESDEEPLGHLLLRACPDWTGVSRSATFVAQVSAFIDRMDQALSHEALRALTYKDELTDLYNQRYLPVVLDEQIERAAKAEGRFSVLFIDVDRFKSVNDQNGHLVGSRILVELSRILREAVRRTDFAFRYGGDEYVVVLPGADAQGAMAAAERIRQRAEKSRFNVNLGDRASTGAAYDAGDDELNGGLKVTVSIGVAAFPDHAKSTRDLLRIADEAMYASKRQSRNAVRLAS